MHSQVESGLDALSIATLALSLTAQALVAMPCTAVERAWASPAGERLPVCRIILLPRAYVR